MLSFECKCTKLCFSIISLAVFAQYEDHLSIYDWCPDQTLWDWLPGVACSLFPDALSGKLWALTKDADFMASCLREATDGCPNLRHESRPYETITSVTHQCSALKALHAVLNRDGLYRFTSRLLLILLLRMETCVSMSQIKSLWTENVFGFFLAFSCYSGGLQQYCQYFDVKWQWIMAVRFFLQQFLLFCSNLTVSF